MEEHPKEKPNRQELCLKEIGQDGILVHGRLVRRFSWGGDGVDRIRGYCQHAVSFGG